VSRCDAEQGLLGMLIRAFMEKRQCTDMYKQLVAGMGMHQYVGENAF
jgi:hypothetical protein